MVYLTVIVPIRNEEVFIEKTLDLVISQEYPVDRYEVIVVDGMSTDRSKEIVRSYIKSHNKIDIRLLENPGILSSRGRNIGIKAARGKLIAVIDGHVYIPTKHLFKDMEELKEKNNALCLARPAPLDVPNLEENTGYWIAVARKSWLGHSKNSYIYSDFEGFVDPVSSGFAYDRSVFKKVGLFDESFDAAEDVEFHFRLKKAGIYAYTSPKFIIYYYPRETLRALFFQQKRYGEGRAKFILKHRDGFTKETPLPSFILLSHLLIPFWLIGFKVIPYLSLLMIGMLVLYWLILLSIGFNESIKKRKPLAGFIVASAFWVTHMGLGWGFIKSILKMKRNMFIKNNI